MTDGDQKRVILHSGCSPRPGMATASALLMTWALGRQQNGPDAAINFPEKKDLQLLDHRLKSI